MVPDDQWIALSICITKHFFIMDRIDIPTTTSSQLVVMTIEDFKRMLQESVEATLQKERAYENVTEITDDTDEEQFLSREEVAQMLDVNLSTLWRWAKAGYLPCVHFGRKVKYPLRLIKLFVERNKGKFQS